MLVPSIHVFGFSVLFDGERVTIFKRNIPTQTKTHVEKNWKRTLHQVLRFKPQFLGQFAIGCEALQTVGRAFAASARIAQLKHFLKKSFIQMPFRQV